jgi:hypothetical protein
MYIKGMVWELDKLEKQARARMSYKRGPENLLMMQRAKKRAPRIRRTSCKRVLMFPRTSSTV